MEDNADDASSNGLDGTVLGATFAPGMDGAAVSFDGANSNITSQQPL